MNDHARAQARKTCIKQIEESSRLVNGDQADVAAAQVNATLAVASAILALDLHVCLGTRDE